MIDEISGQSTGLNEIASNYIDGLADRAKTILAVSAPFMEEAAVAVRAFRDAAGDQPSQPREAPTEGLGLGGISVDALAHQVRRQPLASLAVVGALAAAGYCILRSQKAG